MDEQEAKTLTSGQRIEMAAHTDRWMRGDRFGAIESVGRRLVTIKFDRSGQSMRIHPSAIERVVEIGA